MFQGMDFPSSVAPFILRGVTLVGIDSVIRPREDRLKAWARLATLVDEDMLQSITPTIALDEATPTAERLLKGEVQGVSS